MEPISILSIEAGKYEDERLTVQSNSGSSSSGAESQSQSSSKVNSRSRNSRSKGQTTKYSSHQKTDKESLPSLEMIDYGESMPEASAKSAVFGGKSRSKTTERQRSKGQSKDYFGLDGSAVDLSTEDSSIEQGSNYGKQDKSKQRKSYDEGCFSNFYVLLLVLYHIIMHIQ